MKSFRKGDVLIGTIWRDGHRVHATIRFDEYLGYGRFSAHAIKHPQALAGKRLYDLTDDAWEQHPWDKFYNYVKSR